MIAKSGDSKNKIKNNDQKPRDSCSSVPAFLKKGLDISGTRRYIVSLVFSNSKSKPHPFINHERTVDKSISEYFLRIFEKKSCLL